ncbi:TPA: hypothetical protein ACJ3EH_005448, partial [Klebsiella oxytoca]
MDDDLTYAKVERCARRRTAPRLALRLAGLQATNFCGPVARGRRGFTAPSPGINGNAQASAARFCRLISQNTAT